MVKIYNPFTNLLFVIVCTLFIPFIVFNLLFKYFVVCMIVILSLVWEDGIISTDNWVKISFWFLIEGHSWHEIAWLKLRWQIVLLFLWWKYIIFVLIYFLDVLIHVFIHLRSNRWIALIQFSLRSFLICFKLYLFRFEFLWVFKYVFYLLVGVGVLSWSVSRLDIFITIAGQIICTFTSLP